MFMLNLAKFAKDITQGIALATMRLVLAMDV